MGDKPISIIVEGAEQVAIVMDALRKAGFHTAKPAPHASGAAPQLPTLNVGELDGQSLIDMNNLAIGYLQAPVNREGHTMCTPALAAPATGKLAEAATKLANWLIRVDEVNPECLICEALERKHRRHCDWPKGIEMARAALAAADEEGGAKLPTVDELAQVIREVDGGHDIGAGALSEGILQKLSGRREAQEKKS